VLTLGLGAGVVALLSAPVLVRLAVTVAPPTESLAAAITCAAAYELGVWGPGLGAWLAGRRLGWASGRTSAVVVTAFPALAETAAVHGLGIASPPSALRAGARVVVGGLALVLALRRPCAPPPPADPGL
jgi:hypothetical protein